MKTIYDEKITSFALCAVSVFNIFGDVEKSIEHAHKMASEFDSYEHEEGEKLAREMLNVA